VRIYETTSTHRLQDLAAGLGYQLEIRLIEPHEDGRYFVTASKGIPLAKPAALGWTDEEAISTLRRRTWMSGRLNVF
jgi:hypothetical protein